MSTRQVFVIQSPEDRVCPTGTAHGHDRRFSTCVTTPSTDNPDDAARQRSFLRASSLFVEDLPEMGQRQDHTEKIQKTFAETQGQIAEIFSVHPEVPEVCRGTRVVQRLSRSKTVKIPQQTQRGQSPEGQSRPSEVKVLRARQDPAWSKAQSGQSPRRPDKTQRGQSPEGQTRPSEVRAVRARQDPAWSKA